MSKIEKEVQKMTVATSPAILTGNNYHSWKQVMMAQLQHKGCWEAVQKELSADPAEDREALYILKSSIESKELDKTGVCTTSYELWKILQDNYEGSRSSLIGTVAAEWACFSSKSDEDLIGYCGRFETVLAKLRAVDYAIPDDQKFLIFIKSLPKDRQEFCHTWRMIYDMDSIDELVSAVKARYHADKMMDATKREEQIALFSSSVKGKNAKHAKKKNFAKKDEDKLPKTSKGADKPNTNWQCRYCNKEGHKWRYCPKLRELMGNPGSDQVIIKTSKDENKDSIFMAVNKPLVYSGRRDLWVADSGANCHVTPFKEILTDFKLFLKPREILTGGKTRFALGAGMVMYENTSGNGALKDVLYIPDFPTNIFSLDKVVNLGYDIYVSGMDKTVQILNEEKNIVLSGHKVEQSLLLFELKPVKKQPFFRKDEVACFWTDSNAQEDLK